MTTYEAHRMAAWDEAEQPAPYLAPFTESEGEREAERRAGMFWIVLTCGVGFGVLLATDGPRVWSALCELAGLVWGLVR